MSDKTAVPELIQEIRKGKEILRKLHTHYLEFRNEQLGRMGRNTYSAIIMSEIFVNYYTCLETVFFRISQFFENNLDKEKWHTDLLHKMTLQVADHRKAVISDPSASVLMEFLKFRHFKRYYFDFEYNWDKLDFLNGQYEKIWPQVEKELDVFIGFLEELL